MSSSFQIFVWFTLYSNFILASCEIPESLIIRDVIFAFQGIEGKFIKYDSTKEVFTIDPQVIKPMGFINSYVIFINSFVICISMFSVQVVEELYRFIVKVNRYW